MEKQRAGIIPRWKKHGRELFLGVKNNGRERFREGKTRDITLTLRCRMDARTAARYCALWVHGISTNRDILVPISCVNHLV